VTTAELFDLIAALRAVETDSLHVEAKRAESELPRRLWETVSAFSNTPGGGVLILGLNELSGFEPVGVKNPKKIQQDLASLCAEMEPTVRAVIDLHRVEGKTLVVAEVPEVEIGQKPCYYRGAGLTNGAFIRIGDGDRKLSGYEVQVMLASRGQPREDEAPVPEAGLADLDAELVAGLLGRLRQPEGSIFRRLPDDEALRTLKVLVPHDDGWVPSLGGLLTLGTYPQRFFPALGVTFVVYPTPRVGDSGPHGERLLDNRRFDGPIPRILRPVLDALQRNMKRRAVVRGLFREDLWEYPETAIREALVNALAHRDLSGFARGTSVQIQMFPDRLAIINPGGLFGPVTVERLGEEGISSARNQVLMKLLEDTTEPGAAHVVCENRGSGIGAMLAALRQAGMTPPLFEDRVATFQVTFPNHSLLDEETLLWLNRVARAGLTDSQRMVLAMMHRGDTMTNGLYRQVTGLDSRVVTRELGELVNQGLVEQLGSRRWATYRLAPDRVEKPARLQSGKQRRDRRQEILVILRERGELSRAEIARALRLSDAGARKWLAVLRTEGMVEVTTSDPRSPKARYRLPQAGGRGHAT
jgi:ATP-dependent DNA helicase RecG